MKTDIVYFIEHVARELDIACAVKSLLERRHGLSMEIVSFEMDLDRVLRQYQPDVVAVPYCYSAEDHGLREIWPVWRDANYVNLAFEQIYGKANQVLKLPRDAFAREHVLHHAWGDFYASWLHEHGVPEDNIATNGNPSYALYRSPYSAFFDTRAQLAERHGLDAGRRWVFVPENYGTAFYSDLTMQSIVQAYIRQGFDETVAYRYRDFAQASLEEAARWWQRAAEIGSLELIVRPRPATPLQSFVTAYRDIAGDTPPRLHIIKDGSVREWIMASDVVISSYSTTLIEAAVAGKPIYMLMPLPFPDFMQQNWYDLVPKIETGAQFVEVATVASLESTCKGLRAWAEQNMMSHGDAIVNLADLLASVRLRQRHLPSPPRGSSLPVPAREQPSAWRRRLALARRALARTVQGGKEQAQSDAEPDRVSAAEIALCASRWASFLASSHVHHAEGD